MIIQSRRETINEVLHAQKSPAYRLTQIEKCIYKNNIETYDQMSILPKEIRSALVDKLGPNVLSIKKILENEGDQAHKVLFEAQDTNRFEAVRMTFKPTPERREEHYSLCISSQSGCALGCKFCSTGAIGFKKNLTGEEITDQVLFFKQKGFPVKSVSFMGMGEPFANPHLFDALKILTDNRLLGFRQKRVSISTVGIIPGIQRLMKEFPGVNLAFSLHSPYPAQRLELMPITRAFPIASVMKVLHEYVAETNKKVFIAYVLLDGVNDSPEHAREVLKLIRRQKDKLYLYHVNFIRFNPGNTANAYKKPSREKVARFRQILSSGNVANTLRQSFGVKISAACGQLYAKYEKTPITLGA